MGQRALAFRDGLMIALLIRRLLRIKNFISREIGKNLLIDGEAAGFASQASEMKGKRRLDVIFPGRLILALMRYLDYYRPTLLSESGGGERRRVVDLARRHKARRDLVTQRYRPAHPRSLRRTDPAALVQGRRSDDARARRARIAASDQLDSWPCIARHRHSSL